MTWSEWIGSKLKLVWPEGLHGLDSIYRENGIISLQGSNLVGFMQYTIQSTYLLKSSNSWDIPSSSGSYSRSMGHCGPTHHSSASGTVSSFYSGDHMPLGARVPGTRRLEASLASRAPDICQETQPGRSKSSPELTCTHAGLQTNENTCLKFLNISKLLVFKICLDIF